MRLSDLVAACNGADPELAVEDEHGIPQPVVTIDTTAVVLRNGLLRPVVLLEPSRDEEV